MRCDARRQTVRVPIHLPIHVLPGAASPCTATRSSPQRNDTHPDIGERSQRIGAASHALSHPELGRSTLITLASLPMEVTRRPPDTVLVIASWLPLTLPSVL